MTLYGIWMCYGIWMYMVLYMVWFFQIPYKKVATLDIFINDCKWSSYVHMPQIGLGWHIFKTYRWHDQTCANGLESFFATGCACLFWAKTCNTPPGCYCLCQVILEWLDFLMARSFLAMKTWDMRAVHGSRRSIGLLRSVWRAATSRNPPNRPWSRILLFSCSNQLEPFRAFFPRVIDANIFLNASVLR